jgi:hypothetical protein
MFDPGFVGGAPTIVQAIDRLGLEELRDMKGAALVVGLLKA